MRAERRGGDPVHAMIPLRVSTSSTCPQTSSASEITPFSAFAYVNSTPHMSAWRLKSRAFAFQAAMKALRTRFLIAVWKIRTTLQPIENNHHRPSLIAEWGRGLFAPFAFQNSLPATPPHPVVAAAAQPYTPGQDTSPVAGKIPAPKKQHRANMFSIFAASRAQPSTTCIWCTAPSSASRTFAEPGCSVPSTSMSATPRETPDGLSTLI